MSRKTVMCILTELGYGDEENGADAEYMGALYDVAEKVKALPPVTPKQRTGKWVAGQTIGDGFTCSECDTRYYMYPMSYRFCPNCGAKMEGDS